MCSPSANTVGISVEQVNFSVIFPAVLSVFLFINAEIKTVLLHALVLHIIPPSI
jgi:hypothetical protein